MDVDTAIIIGCIGLMLCLFAVFKAWQAGYKRGWHDKEYLEGVDEAIQSLGIRREHWLED